MDIFGIRFVGVTSENAHKLLLTLALIALIVILRAVAGAIANWYLKGHPNERVRFWTWQAISLISAAIAILGTLSIWFDDPKRLETAAGFVTAGLAFALQRVITAFAGYFVILRGRNFQIGDRIMMGGVRGDVIAVGFMQTTVMEMGQSPPEQGDDPAMWVRSRQFTGRIVTITNDKIFEQPVYNYTRDFPFIWEEMMIPIKYADDRRRVEEIILEAARRHTLKISELGEEAIKRMRERYFLRPTDLEPKVYMRLTDNWLELTVRFVVRDHGTRHIKDAMSREILDALDAAGIGLASATFDIVGLPPLKIEDGIQIKVEQKEQG